MRFAFALRQAVATVLIGIAPVALLEGGLRLAGWPTGRVRTFGKLLNFDAATWHEAVGMFRPGASSTVLWPPELAYHVRINALGLRGPEIERRAPPGRLRILALGDSMTFGYYLEDDQTWPARLEARLRAEGRDVEVVNAGVGGWSIESETRFLIERGLALEPDQVVLAFCVNDIADLERSGAVYEGQKHAVETGAALRQAVYDSAVYELYLRAQVAWKHWREEQGLRVPDPLGSSELPGERLEAAWAKYAAWLDRLVAALEPRGIPLTLVYIPDIEKRLKGQPAADEVRLRELARARGLGFVSPRADFERRPIEALYQWPIDGHLAPEGADRLARAVTAELTPQSADR